MGTSPCLTKRRVGSAVDGHDQGSAVDIESDVGLVSSIRWYDVADRGRALEFFSVADLAGGFLCCYVLNQGEIVRTPIPSVADGGHQG